MLRMQEFFFGWVGQGLFRYLKEKETMMLGGSVAEDGYLFSRKVATLPLRTF